MTKEQKPAHPSVREMRKAIASIPKEVVGRAVQEAEKEFARKIEEIGDKHRKAWADLHTRPPFTI